jgi:subtilisin family serine protease
MKRITICFTLLVLMAFGLLLEPRSGQSQQSQFPDIPPEFSPLNTSRPAQQQRSLTPRTKFVKGQNPIPNRYIVVLNDDVVSDDNNNNVVLSDDVVGADHSRQVRLERVTEIANSHARAHRGTVGYVYETALKGYSIELPNEAAAIAISKSPQVQWVEEDERFEPGQAPASPQASPPWGLDAIDGTMPAPVPNATGRTNGQYLFNATGAGVNAYVIDTGINTAHQDFQTPFFSRASQAADCIRNNDCRTGPPSPFVDTACAYPMPNTTNNDCWGHGTHVAGTLGGNNYGAAKGVAIRSVKVCAVGYGCPASAIIAGVNWVTSDHIATNAVPAVANISLWADNSTPFNPPYTNHTGIDSAVNHSINNGVTYVIIAGNANADARNFHPADVEAALTVGAVDWNGNRPTFSNWGPGVDLFAPGVDVVSAQTGNQMGGYCAIWNGSNTSECRASGTSMAAPHVAGVAAMYMQGRPGVTGCGAFPIQGPAPANGNLSNCPDRVARFIKATANLDRLTNTINGTTTDPNGNQITVASPNRFLWNIWVPTSANPIDNPHFFFWTQYADFLNREPDNGGLQFYLNILNGCAPSDTECIRATRGALSANFFRSPEFGQRGGYVANLFNIVIGQRPKTVAELSDPTKVERPHYAEFTADLAFLSGTDAEANFKKGQLAAAWLGRAEVQAILPNSLSNQQFVQKLESIAGVILSNESTLIANLNNGSQTRAQVLRAVAESNQVIEKFQLQNFVTMQYIGHLRREPENCHGSPDPANCGYIFHYNRFAPGPDPHQIENLITRGFIESPEYRRRFGPN